MAIKRLRFQLFGLSGGIAAAALGVLLVSSQAVAQRGFFDSLFGPSPRYYDRPAPQADFSRAPPPRKAETPPTSTVLVLGDSMADWLASGLEEALVDLPELGVIRKHRTYSGLIRYENRADAPDWPQVARDAIAADKPKFVVVMLGLQDRQAIREPVAPQRGTPAPAQTPAPSATPPEPDAERPDASNPDQPAIAAPEQPRPRVAGVHEYRSEQWIELYSKRIDAMIAAAKTGGVPVFWIGLPSVRGARSTSDMLYLNELYRARAEKAAITYIDVWDGFVDEGGRFTIQGPDFDGQIRRLRAGDGVHFTKFGARKLAHYVEREIRRLLERGPVAIALPSSEPQPQAPGTRATGATVRPLAGPVLPLTSALSASGEELLGGANKQDRPGHVTATRVLVKGEAVAVPAGRSDDFAWPRRTVAPFNTDPVVATTTLPLPVMQPPPAKTVLAPNLDTPAAPRPTAVAAKPKEPSVRRQAPSFPFFLPFFGR